MGIYNSFKHSIGPDIEMSPQLPPGSLAVPFLQKTVFMAQDYLEELPLFRVATLFENFEKRSSALRDIFVEVAILSVEG